MRENETCEVIEKDTNSSISESVPNAVLLSVVYPKLHFDEVITDFNLKSFVFNVLLQKLKILPQIRQGFQFNIFL